MRFTEVLDLCFILGGMFITGNEFQRGAPVGAMIWLFVTLVMAVQFGYDRGRRARG